MNSWTIACQVPLSMGILQAKILEWVARPSSRGLSQPRDQTQVSHTAGGFFTIWATREGHWKLEWVAYSFSRESFWPKNQTRVSCITGGFFTSWATGEGNCFLIVLLAFLVHFFFCCLVIQWLYLVLGFYYCCFVDVPVIYFWLIITMVLIYSNLYIHVIILSCWSLNLKVNHNKTCSDVLFSKQIKKIVIQLFWLWNIGCTEMSIKGPGMV